MKYWIIVLSVAVFAIWPLLEPGFIPTHDGEFSIIRIWQYSKMMREGHLFPRWAPDLNSGYGVPLFTFYYPLPYFIGSLFHLSGSTLVDSFKLTMAFSYVLSVILCFLWLKKLFHPHAATIGTVFFMTVPYWFVNLYVRGSLGEVMAISMLILALVGIEYGSWHIAAFGVAALILSHNIAAFIFLPLLTLYIFSRKKSLGVLMWGIALSTFFWLPATAEQKFVLGLSNFDFRDHFPQLAQLLIPSWGTGFSRPGWPHDEMSPQIGIAAIALLVLRPRSLIFALPIAFLMLEQSIPLWERIGPLRFIQYPWRLLMVFIPVTGFLGAQIARRKGFWASLLAGISLILVFPYSRPVTYEPRSDEYYLSRREFTDGTTTVGNSFSTVWLPWQKERASQIFEKGQGESIIANISYYPGWVAIVDGKIIEVKENAGRIQFDVPRGSNYELRFQETPLRRASDAISVVSLFWLLVSAILDHRYARSNRYNSPQKRS